MKSWWIIPLVLVVAAVVWMSVVSARKGVPVETAVVAEASIREFVDERGKTRLPQTHLVTMPYDGRIARIALHEGDAVQADQVVARVIASDLENAVTQARSVVERLDAAIRENNDATVEQTTEQQALKFVESMVHTVAAADERVKAGETRLDYAEKNLARITRLFETGARTQDHVDLANVEYVQAQVDYREDVLVSRAAASIKAATELLPKAVRQFIQRKDLARVVLEKQKAEAEAALQQALLDQQRGTMASPVDGVVLTRPIQNERQVAAGTVLMEIGELGLLEVETDVLSQDVVDVKVGDAVEIYGPAVGRNVGAGVAGVVDRVFPAGFTKISSLGVEQQRVKVVVRFDAEQLATLRTQRDLGVDYRVRVRIFTAAKETAPVVPRSSLFRGPAGDWRVFVIRRGRAELQPVQVGLMNDSHVELRDGVELHEQVVLAPESTLTAGARVTVEATSR